MADHAVGNWDLCFLAIQRSVDISSLKNEGYLQTLGPHSLLGRVCSKHWNLICFPHKFHVRRNREQRQCFLVWVLSGQWDPSLQQFILPFERQPREAPNSDCCDSFTDDILVCNVVSARYWGCISVQCTLMYTIKISQDLECCWHTYDICK